jgi:hypothetical protein
MRLWPFKKSSVLSNKSEAWMKTQFDWLIEQFGEMTDFNNRGIVLPTAETFKTGGKQGHELAIHLFDQVKLYAGMSQFAINLVPLEQSYPDYEGDNIIKPVYDDGSAAGIYILDEDGVAQIQYDVNLLQEPMRLIATLAHELAHDLHTFSPQPLPEDELEEEFLTDLTSIFLGYGVFMSNTAFEYNQFQDGNLSGWSYNRLHYLPQNELVYGTALFIQKQNIDPSSVLKHLKPGLAKTLQKSLASLQNA